MEKIKLLYLTPHLSTGGMPQFVLKRIESLQKYKDELEIFLIEYSQFSDTYVVQRNKIIELLDVGHFFTLGGTTQTEKKNELLLILKDLKIDIIHTEEIPEAFESFNKIPLYNEYPLLLTFGFFQTLIEKYHSDGFFFPSLQQGLKAMGDCNQAFFPI